jgi:oligopeptidase B
LIRHNSDGAEDFKISKTPIDQPNDTHWEDHWPHQKGRPITDFLVFRNYYAVAYRELGLPKIFVQEKATNDIHDIILDQDDYNLYPIQGTEWDSDILRFGYSSLKTPSTIYDYNMKSRTRILQKQSEVLGSFSEEQYVTRRIYAQASDGVLIPISLVHRSDIEIDQSTPLYLYGYGAYGIVVESDFSSVMLSLLDRGFIFAVAHIRGGMDLGWEWYENGKLLNKKNTFIDFIDAADYLISAGYTSSGKLVACGGSAGGLLMGAVANMRPDLFQAIVAHVPFVDIINTMLDDTLPLTTMEYNEWGNPNDPEFFNYIKSYSPYDNVIPQEYPHMLVTGGISDPRVTYWEPTKWVASLRDAYMGDNMLLLKIHMESGHSGASGRFDRLEEVALEYAFILKALNML